MDTNTGDCYTVLKVKHGDFLKRFNACVNGQVADMDMAMLRTKIREAFKIPLEKNFTLAYIDKDGDSVMLADDTDLLDALIKQKLNPLRINLELMPMAQPMDIDNNPESKTNIPFNRSRKPFQGEPSDKSQQTCAIKTREVLKPDSYRYFGGSEQYGPIRGANRSLSFRNREDDTYDYKHEMYDDSMIEFFDGCRIRPSLEERKGKPHLSGPCFSHKYKSKQLSSSDVGGFLSSYLVKDFNIPSGNQFLPSTPFTKTWHIKNDGTTPWPVGCCLTWYGGHQLTNTMSIRLQIPSSGLPVREQIDVSIDLIAPSFLGRFESIWQLQTPSGTKFGCPVPVIIKVVANSSSSANAKGIPCSNRNISAQNTNIERTKEDCFEPMTFSDIEGATGHVDLGKGKMDQAEEDDLEDRMIKELEDMGFKYVALNRDILRGNGYNLEQAIRVLCNSYESESDMDF